MNSLGINKIKIGRPVAQGKVVEGGSPASKARLDPEIVHN